MTSLTDLRKMNTAEKWKGLYKDLAYVAASRDFRVWAFPAEPHFTYGRWAGEGHRCPEPLTVHNSIARLAVQITLEHGYEHSLLARYSGTKFWKPRNEGSYYYPIHSTAQHPRKYNLTSVWVNGPQDNCLYKEGLVFIYPKYCEWVVREGKNLYILQAAIAVDGLASSEDIFNEGTFCYFINNFYSTKYNKWMALIEKTNIYIPEKVYFKSREKVQEAIQVRLPDGRTLRNYLEKEAE